MSCFVNNVGVQISCCIDRGQLRFTCSALACMLASGCGIVQLALQAQGAWGVLSFVR